MFDVQDQDSASATLSQIQLSVERVSAFAKILYLYINNFKTSTRDYPLNSKNLKFRNFRKRLTGFLSNFVSQLSIRNYLYNSTVFEDIMSWVVAMSSSTMRPIRHTATVFCLNIMTFLCEKSKELLNEHAIATKQLEKEEKRSRVNRNRINELNNSLGEIVKQQDTLTTYLNDYFDR